MLFNIPGLTAQKLIGTAAPADVLKGKTFYNTDPKNILTGTLVLPTLNRIAYVANAGWGGGTSYTYDISGYSKVIIFGFTVYYQKYFTFGITKTSGSCTFTTVMNPNYNQGDQYIAAILYEVTNISSSCKITLPANAGWQTFAIYGIK